MRASAALKRLITQHFRRHRDCFCVIPAEVDAELCATAVLSAPSLGQNCSNVRSVLLGISVRFALLFYSLLLFGVLLAHPSNGLLIHCSAVLGCIMIWFCALCCAVVRPPAEHFEHFTAFVVCIMFHSAQPSLCEKFCENLGTGLVSLGGLVRARIVHATLFFRDFESRTKILNQRFSTVRRKPSSVYLLLSSLIPSPSDVDLPLVAVVVARLLHVFTLVAQLGWFNHGSILRCPSVYFVMLYPLLRSLLRCSCCRAALLCSASVLRTLRGSGQMQHLNDAWL
jgi:hypothetical protein